MQRRGEDGGGDGDTPGMAPTHSFASRTGKPSGAGLTAGSSLAFLTSGAGGTLDASRTLEKEAEG